MHDGAPLHDHRFHPRHSGTPLQPTLRLGTVAGHGENRTGVRATCELGHCAASTEHTLRSHGQFPGTVHIKEPQPAKVVQQTPTNIYTLRRFLLHVPPKSGVDQQAAFLTITRRYANRYFDPVGMLLSNYGSACSKAQNPGGPLCHLTCTPPPHGEPCSSRRHAKLSGSRSVISTHSRLGLLQQFLRYRRKTTRLERTVPRQGATVSPTIGHGHSSHLVCEQLQVIYHRRHRQHTQTSLDTHKPTKCSPPATSHLCNACPPPPPSRHYAQRGRPLLHPQTARAATSTITSGATPTIRRGLHSMV